MQPVMRRTRQPTTLPFQVCAGRDFRVSMASPHPLQTSQPNSSLLSAVGQGLAKSPGPVVALFAVSLVSNLLMLTGPLFMLQIYDRVLVSRSMPTLVAFSLMAVALYAFYAVLEWIRSRMTTRFAAMIDESLSRTLLEGAVRLKLMPAGGPVVDPIRDLESLRAFVAGQGPLSLLDIPWVPIYVGIVFLFHPLLGWTAVAGAAVICALMLVNEVRSQKPSQEMTAANARRVSLADDARGNAESIIAMGMMPGIGQRWLERTRDLLAAQQTAADRLALYSNIIKGFRFLLQSAVLAVGAYLVLLGEVTGGVMIAASIMTSRALAPVEQTVANWRGFVAARQALNRLMPILAALKSRQPTTSLPLPRQTLSLVNVATAPDRQRKPLVSGVTFLLTAGDGLGVLGLSGSGKSSLVRAITGVWPLLQGEVRLDGSELTHYDPERLGTAIGYLPQSVDLFDGTVAENIARFSPDASDEAVLKAAQAARCHELVTSLPNGYDTRIGERGTALSAGQRQRIGLARALYGEPFLVVLDEPNSNLDSEGDAALTDALKQARARGAIVIVVAHRPSAIAAVDKLLFLQNGRQAAFGPKDDVLRQITQQPTLVDAGRGVRSIA
jgi:ATP-binding cassette subfamily C protein PrsD